ncbi:MAG: hypothetical protein CVT63_06110 [Candidatus Anoxymicrobium japonicum]|uniref:Helicase HerA central domain-containing protein n=1 Tax=Candidatus Anoxymicrobium japonicum TaxID=2013648 RepID=A0A2N3G501_9ACTN|nr:MAG: hypothetical protein CVT63_06110 [Candidatus Anoxymicrobium japonicum]
MEEARCVREIGRVVGRNVTEILFRTGYSTPISVGEIITAKDGEAGDVHYLRVIDVMHGNDAFSGSFMERTAGNMMAGGHNENGYVLHDRERRLFKLVRTVPLGYAPAGENGASFRKPKVLPPHFSTVRRVCESDFSFLAGHSGEIEIGMLRSGEKVLNIPIGVGANDLPSHVGVFATTGMGKSNLMKTFAASVMRRGGCGLLLIDPHGEYYDGGASGTLKGLRDAPGQDNFVVYSSRPFSGSYNRIMLSAHEITVEDVENVYPFSQAQAEALWQISSRYGRRWLMELADSDIKTLVDAFERKIQDVTFAVLKRRAERILGSDVVHRDEKVSASGSIVEALHSGKVVLVDTSSLYNEEELLVGAVLARRLFGENKKAYIDGKRFRKLPPVLISLEEAQRVLGTAQQGNIFTRIAREGRKFKVGICAVTQQPKLIPNELLSQFNTMFLLGLSDDGDRNIVRGCAKQDISALGTEIQTLERGEALITSPSAPFALPVKIHLYEDYIKITADDAKIAKKANAVEDKTIDDDFY